MSEVLHPSNRRAFIANSLQVGAGALLGGAAVESVAAAVPGESSSTQPSSAKSRPAWPQVLIDLPARPSRVFVEHDHSEIVAANRAGARFSTEKAVIVRHEHMNLAREEGA
jgi:hypothetical protein